MGISLSLIKKKRCNFLQKNKMYYLELIQRFWDFNKTAKISPTEALLYFYLLKMGYENERYDFHVGAVLLPGSFTTLSVGRP